MMTDYSMKRSSSHLRCKLRYRQVQGCADITKSIAHLPLLLGDAMDFVSLASVRQIKVTPFNDIFISEI